MEPLVTEHHRFSTRTDGKFPDLHVLDYEVDGNEKRISVMAISADTIRVSTHKGKVDIPQHLVRHVVEALVEASGGQ